MTVPPLNTIREYTPSSPTDTYLQANEFVYEYEILDYEILHHQFAVLQSAC